jgi:hypothetical protein
MQTTTIRSFRINGGPCLPVSPIYGETACNASIEGDFSWIWNSSFLPNDLAFIPDTYQLQVNGAAKSFSLPEGALSEIPIALPVLGSVPATFDANFNYPDARELPWSGQSNTISSSCAGERSYALPSNLQGSLNTKAFVNSACTYTVTIGGRTQTLDQNQSNSITVNHIDVDDVEVAREDGTIYQARGTYELFFGGNRVVGPLSTDTGLDLLPGTYELVIKYTTVDGPKTQRQTFTL